MHQVQYGRVHQEGFLLVQQGVHIKVTFYFILSKGLKLLTFLLVLYMFCNMSSLPIEEVVYEVER